MKKLLTILALILSMATVGQAQLPTTFFQEAFSYEAGTTSSSTSFVADGALWTLYPEGSFYNVPNLGNVAAYEANGEVRVVESDGSGNVPSQPNYLGYLLYVAPGQINIEANAGYFSAPSGGVFMPIVVGGGLRYWVVQRKISGTWTNVSSPSQVYPQWARPTILINVGTDQAIAALYCSFDGELLRVNTSAPGNNPRNHVHGLVAYPTIISFYLGNCEQDQPSPPGPGSYVPSQILVNGTDQSSLKQHAYPIKIGLGLWQQNIVRPSGVSGSTTFQIGMGRYFWQGFNLYGNTVKISNWVD